MKDDKYDLYRRWMSCNLEQNLRQDKRIVHNSFVHSIKNTLAYHNNALINGVLQPIAATRTDTNKCQVALDGIGKIHIGDLVEVFDENWLCVELHNDEFDMAYAELWLCNHIFQYQDFDMNIISKHAVLDDGSFSKGSDKPIPVTNNSYVCYVSYDNESKALHIDKRLGISVIKDSKGKDVLEVGRIKWIDVKSKNFGEGSHLMVFGMSDDQYSPEKDNLEKLICDYQEKYRKYDDGKEEATNPTGVKYKLIINGRSVIRAGSERTYTISAIDIKTGNELSPPCNMEWSAEGVIPGISIYPAEAKCKVAINEDDNLVGSTFSLFCKCNSGDFEEAIIEVEVS